MHALRQILRAAEKFTGKNFSLLTVGVIAVYAVLFCMNVRLSDPEIKKVIYSDGHGYYYYLPSLFLNNGNDRPFAWTDETYYDVHPSKTSLNYNSDTLRLNKYYIGTAICELPFFWAGHAVSLMTEDEHHAYTPVHQTAIAIAGIAFLLLGLLNTRRTLRLMNLSEFTTGITVLMLFFCTNLINYALWEPSMSHVYTFGLFALLFRLAMQLASGFQTGKFLIFTFTAGLLLTIRPVNILLLPLLLPLMGKQQFTAVLLQLWYKKHVIIAGMLAAAIPLSMQAAVFYIQTGHFWFYSYGGEYFHFSQPQTWDFLFSFRKGWLLYTPVMAFALIGLLFWRTDKFRLFSSLIALSLFIYVTSCWNDWSYGGSYSQRPMIDAYAFLAIPFALLTSRLIQRFVITTAFVMILILLAFVNLTQFEQYRKSILPFDHTTKEIYSHIFLQTGNQFIGLYTDSARHKTVLLPGQIIKTYTNNFEKPDQYWNTFDSRIVENGNHVIRMQHKNHFGCEWIFPADSLFSDSITPENRKNLRIRLHYDCLIRDNTTDAEMITAVRRGNNIVFWQQKFLIEQTRTEQQWSTQEWETSPLPINKGDEIIIRFYQSEKGDNDLDNMRIEFVADH